MIHIFLFNFTINSTLLLIQFSDLGNITAQKEFFWPVFFKYLPAAQYFFVFLSILFWECSGNLIDRPTIFWKSPLRENLRSTTAFNKKNYFFILETNLKSEVESFLNASKVFKMFECAELCRFLFEKDS